MVIDRLRLVVNAQQIVVLRFYNYFSYSLSMKLNELFKPYFLFAQKILNRPSTKYANHAVTLKFIAPNSRSITKCISSVIKYF